MVCGARNFAPGDVVPWAAPGAKLPGGVEIGRRKVRGAALRRHARLRPRAGRVRRPLRDPGAAARHPGRGRRGRGGRAARHRARRQDRPQPRRHPVHAGHRPRGRAAARQGAEAARPDGARDRPPGRAAWPRWRSRTPRAARCTPPGSSRDWTRPGPARCGWPGGCTCTASGRSGRWSTSPTTCCSTRASRCTPSTSTWSRAAASWSAGPPRARPSAPSTAATAP